ncbi:uncharacterized protein LOC123296837 [Chrysoperla carnea]|uniref:uncharacterized protein LOC123296837 n=1 Tax=Chrysoperla carnea TaxID=189513 RepID=UPI001D08E783|nr:uncharacterized protein LOC123296837 [Chrysoperla carnea]
MARQIQKTLIFVTVFISLIVLSSCKSLVLKRAIAEKNSDLGEQKRICKNQTPCGWAVYTSITKTIDYFMTNSRCSCPENFTCGRTDDDLSISAYVYRCLNATQAAANPDDPFAFRPKAT